MLFLYGVAVAVFHGLGDVVGVFGCAVVAWFVVIWIGRRGWEEVV
jgi:hypothetical protein